MEIEKNDINIFFNNYLSKVNSLIMSYVPMKKLNQQQQKFLQKPWFTTAIQNSIQKKSRLFKKYIKYQNTVTKIDLHIEHKSYNLQEINYPQSQKKVKESIIMII